MPSIQVWFRPAEKLAAIAIAAAACSASRPSSDATAAAAPSVPNTGVERKPRAVEGAASRSPTAAATSQPAITATAKAAPSRPSRSATASAAGWIADPTWVLAAKCVSSCARVCMIAAFANAACSAETRAPSHSSPASPGPDARASVHSSRPAVCAPIAHARLCSTLQRSFSTTSPGIASSVRPATNSPSSRPAARWMVTPVTSAAPRTPG